VKKTTNSFERPTPILMSSSCTVLANNSAIPDSGQLSYPFRKAVLIEEIRWDMTTPLVGPLTNLGSLVSTKLMLGDLYLMRDPVPVFILGTFMSLEAEQGSELSPNGSLVSSHYRWRLPEPLYVEAGQVLSSWFTRGNDGVGAIDVQVSYVGKTVPPEQARPKIIAVPYAAPWVTTLGNAYQQSNEFDLFNPFTNTLQVQRLTGRVTVNQQTSLRAITPAPLFSSPVAINITLLMNDSWGGKMVNNPTGPSDVFDILRGAWTVDTAMPPKGVYEIRAFNLTSGGTQPTPFQLFVAVIGTREEKL